MIAIDIDEILLEKAEMSPRPLGKTVELWAFHDRREVNA